MSVSREDVIRIAELARLHLTESESKSLGEDLNGILEYVDAISSVPEEMVKDCDTIQDGTSERRSGEQYPDHMSDPPSCHAPDYREEFFVVPSPPSLGTDVEPPS